MMNVLSNCRESQAKFLKKVLRILHQTVLSMSCLRIMQGFEVPYSDANALCAACSSAAAFGGVIGCPSYSAFPEAGVTYQLL